MTTEQEPVVEAEPQQLESDIVIETARQELMREEIVQRFESDHALLVESFRNVEEPTEDDIDAFRDTKTSLRTRLVTDLFATVEHLASSDRSVFFTNLYDGLLQESYIAERTAHVVAERFQAKLTRNGESRGLDPKEFEEFDTKSFASRVQFVQGLVLLDGMLDAVGLGSVKSTVLESEIHLHYALRSGALKK